MAGSVNKVIILGRVGGDPEIRMAGESKVARFSVATGEAYTNKHGEKVENTEWHRVELWEGAAGVAERYVRKGGMVYIEGQIRTDRWTNKDGIEVTSTTIRGHNLTLCGGNGNPTLPENGITNGNRPAQPAPSTPAPAQQNSQLPPVTLFTKEDEDDLPF